MTTETMNELLHRTPINQKDPSTYGGLIYPSDFNTNFRANGNAGSSAIAARILSDQRFDMQCRKKQEEKERGAFTSAGLELR